MGRAHSYAYNSAAQLFELDYEPTVSVIAGRDRERTSAAASSYGIPDSTTDWRELIERDEVEIVDICTPPGTHAEMIEAAAGAGKAIICEKPLCVSYADGTRAIQAVRDAGVLNAAGFNYRKLPAVALMNKMITAGRVGEVINFRASWLSDEFLDPSIPFDWRFQRTLGGTTISDLGSHLIDLATWMVGSIEEVVAQSSTITKQRPDSSSGRMIEVDVDDASSALASFKSGARGVFEMSRVSARHPCDFTIEVNGTRGSLRFDYPRLNELWFGDSTTDDSLSGMQLIRAEHHTHPFAAQWWPIGQGVGYDASFINQAATLLQTWPDGPWAPDLETALEVQAVCEAMARSAEEHRWVPISERCDWNTPTSFGTS